MVVSIRSPSPRIASSDRGASETRWRQPLRDVGVVLLLVVPLLYLSNRIGGTTLLGGALGWAGLMSGAVVSLLLAGRRDGGFTALGLGTPRSWLLTVAFGLVTAMAIVFVGNTLLAWIIPLLGDPPDSSRFEVIRGNLPALLVGLFSVWTAAAVGEEVVFRGFVMGRLARVLGNGAVGWTASLVLTSAVFGLIHFYQGFSGVVITGLIGLMIGAAYLAVGRNLWVVILAHGLVDTFSFVTIYSS